MHLVADRASMRPGGDIGRPYARLREFLMEILDDRHAVPDTKRSVDKYRNAAGRRNRFQPLHFVGGGKIDDLFIEGDTEMAHEQPDTHRPWRIGLVADDEPHFKPSPTA